MDTHLRDDLERSFGDGPPVDDTDLLLDRGRTALRRRRLVEGVSALAVAAVVAAGALAASGGAGRGAGLTRRQAYFRIRPPRPGSGVYLDRR